MSGRTPQKSSGGTSIAKQAECRSVVHVCKTGNAPKGSPENAGTREAGCGGPWPTAAVFFGGTPNGAVCRPHHLVIPTKSIFGGKTGTVLPDLVSAPPCYGDARGSGGGGTPPDSHGNMTLPECFFKTMLVFSPLRGSRHGSGKSSSFGRKFSYGSSCYHALTQRASPSGLLPKGYAPSGLLHKGAALDRRSTSST